MLLLPALPAVLILGRQCPLRDSPQPPYPQTPHTPILLPSPLSLSLPSLLLLPQHPTPSFSLLSSLLLPQLLPLSLLSLPAPHLLPSASYTQPLHLQPPLIFLLSLFPSSPTLRSPLSSSFPFALSFLPINFLLSPSDSSPKTLPFSSFYSLPPSSATSLTSALPVSASSTSSLLLFTSLSPSSPLFNPMPPASSLPLLYPWLPNLNSSHLSLLPSPSLPQALLKSSPRPLPHRLLPLDLLPSPPPPQPSVPTFSPLAFSQFLSLNHLLHPFSFSLLSLLSRSAFSLA